MLLDIVKKGATDRSVTLRIIDSADGTPETGVVFNTSGIDLWYRREGAAVTSVTEATLAALTTAHADGGFLHVSHGVYRFDLPDAAFATGANYVDIGGTVTGMIVIGGRVRLVDYDPEDTVRLGLTALPNAAAEAAGGLYTRGTGAGQINQPANGRIAVDATHVGGTSQTGRDIGASVLISSGTGTGQLSVTSGVVAANVTQFGGTNATATGGRPEVNASHIAGSAVSTTTAQLGVNVVNAGGTAWASGSLTAGVLAADAITAAKIADGAIDRATFAADTGLQTVRSNTAQAGGASTITLDASASSTTDFYKYALIYLTGGTGAGQAGYCTAYNGTTKVATVSAAWATAPDNTTTFAIFPNGASTVAGTVDANVTQFGGAAGTFASGLPSVNLATDLYHADICFTRDQANTQDEYTVTWFKNGVRLTSGVTSPTIQVVKRADGTDLVAATAMTEVGSTETFKYDATGSSRVTQGEAVLVVVAATIDSGSRTFSRLVSRDST